MRPCSETGSTSTACPGSFGRRRSDGAPPPRGRCWTTTSGSRTPWSSLWPGPQRGPSSSRRWCTTSHRRPGMDDFKDLGSEIVGIISVRPKQIFYRNTENRNRPFGKTEIRPKPNILPKYSYFCRNGELSAETLLFLPNQCCVCRNNTISAKIVG